MGSVRIVDFVDTHDLILVNIWFIKQLSYLPIFYSKYSKTQIEYILITLQVFYKFKALEILGITIALEGEPM